MMRSPLDMNYDERRSDLIRRCFIDMADGDYLTARWAYHHGISHTFYWNAAQALEKYAKACLLYNDLSVSDGDHNLIRLVQKVREICGDDAIPRLISMPQTTGMRRDAWDGKETDLFVDFLNTYGSPGNRYCEAGSFTDGPVVHIMDRLCEAIRRKMRYQNFLTSDLLSFYNNQSSIDDQVSGREWMIGGDLLLEKLYVKRYDAGMNETVRSQFSAMNFSFFPTDQIAGNTFGGFIFKGSPLLNHLVRLAKRDASKENIEIIHQLRSWVSTHIKLSRPLDQEIKRNTL